MDADTDDDELTLEANAADTDDDELTLEANETSAEEDGDELQLEDNGHEEANDDDDGPSLEDNPAEDISRSPSASELREKGNIAFKAGHLEEARRLYSKALAYADNAERSTLLANRAACALRQRDWAGAINDCTAALSVSATCAAPPAHRRHRTQQCFSPPKHTHDHEKKIAHHTC